MVRKQDGQKKGRAVLLLMLGGLCALVLFFASLIVQTYREYVHFKERESEIERKLAEAREEFERKEAYLGRLLDDREFLERVVRERLGYARPDELLFRFSDEL